MKSKWSAFKVAGVTKEVPWARKNKSVRCVNIPGKGNECRGDKFLVCTRRAAKDLRALNDWMIKMKKKLCCYVQSNAPGQNQLFIYRVKPQISWKQIMDLLRVFLRKSQLSCLVGFAEGKRTKDHSQNWVQAEHVSLGSNFMLALLTVFIREESGGQDSSTWRWRKGKRTRRREIVRDLQKSQPAPK